MILPDISHLSLKAHEHPAVKAGRAADARKAAHNPEFWALLARIGAGHHHAPPPVPPPPPAPPPPLASIAAMFPPRRATLRDIAKAAARGAAKLQRRPE